jgi:hypothetical protein
MSTQQWRHTEPSDVGTAGAWPVAPWASHPDAPLDRDLFAELLAVLRDDVIGWADIAADASTPYAAARLEGAQAALKLADRIARRNSNPYRTDARARGVVVL